MMAINEQRMLALPASPAIHYHQDIERV